jgi:hypothetical protein
LDYTIRSPAPHRAISTTLLWHMFVLLCPYHRGGLQTWRSKCDDVTAVARRNVSFTSPNQASQQPSRGMSTHSWCWTLCSRAHGVSEIRMKFQQATAASHSVQLRSASDGRESLRLLRSSPTKLAASCQLLKFYASGKQAAEDRGGQLGSAAATRKRSFAARIDGADTRVATGPFNRPRPEQKIPARLSMLSSQSASRQFRMCQRASAVTLCCFRMCKAATLSDTHLTTWLPVG